MRGKLLTLLCASMGLLIYCDYTPPTIPSDLVIPCEPKLWPQPDPDGKYGHEDPRYPPRLDQCPADYYPAYNGHNWICSKDYFYREFPSN